MEYGQQFVTLGAADQINLAQQDDISELHLLDQQLADAALVFGQCFVAIEIDRAHVVDDNGHLQTLAVAQDLIQQSGFSSAEKAGQYGNEEMGGHEGIRSRYQLL
jgi:hypothetical protein